MIRVSYVKIYASGTVGSKTDISLKGHYDEKIVCLLLISIRHHLNIHLQYAFSFLINIWSCSRDIRLLTAVIKTAIET